MNRRLPNPCLTLLAVGSISATLLAGACGGTSPTPTAQTDHGGVTTQAASNRATFNYPPAPVETAIDADRDNDIHSRPGDDTNNERVLAYGRPASPTLTRTITSLLKRYYAAALAGDGARACSMIYSTLAEAVPEDYGLSPPGPVYSRGTTCAQVLTLTFKHFHPQLALEVPHLSVQRVLLEQHHGEAILRFGRLPERLILVAREGLVWRVGELLDRELP